MAAFWIDWAIRSSVLLAAGLLSAALMRKTSAKHRHMMLVVILMASAMLPLLTAAFCWQELNVFPWQKEVSHSAAVLDSGSIVVKQAGFTWLWFAFAIPILLLARMATAWMRLSALSGKTLHKSSIRRVSVHVSDDPRIKTAMTWGFLQPRIVIPACSQVWPKDRMASVLQHEMAHIVRRDWAVQQLSYIAVCFLWYNPLAWMILKRLLLEAERAADDLVLEQGISPADYAQHLLDCARNMTRKQQTAYAGIHATRNGNLETRLRYILDPECRLKARASLPAAASLALAVLSLPILLVRLEGQAARQTMPPIISGESQGVDVVQSDVESEGGPNLPCIVNTASKSSAKLKVSSTAVYSQITSKRRNTVLKSQTFRLAKGQPLTHQTISVSVSGNPSVSVLSLSKLKKHVVVTAKSITATDSDESSKAATAFIDGNVIAVSASPIESDDSNAKGSTTISYVAETEAGERGHEDVGTKSIKIIFGGNQDLDISDFNTKEFKIELSRSIWRALPISIIDKTNVAGRKKLIASDHKGIRTSVLLCQERMFFQLPATFTIGLAS